jgi:glycosyltransferase involved in cell wall biosynthesis
MIGVVVPAHDEEALIGRCLDALQVAARHPDLLGEQVSVVVVLDACTDRTAMIAAARGVHCLPLQARNVGAARSAGADLLIAAGARWLAFTDADSIVSPAWLVRQLGLQADAVCGVVSVDDWSDYSLETRQCYDARYVDADGHRHVHGANLGVSTAAYLNAGGFAALRSSEDVALVQALTACGATIAWSADVRVHTSARRVARAPDGFAAYLAGLPGAMPVTVAGALTG